MREGDRAPRRPGTVPDEVDAPPGIDVRSGADTDGNGTPDTLLTELGVDLLAHVDLDGDGFADRVLRVGADAPDDAPEVDGSAAAVPGWSAWLGRLFG